MTAGLTGYAVYSRQQQVVGAIAARLRLEIANRIEDQLAEQTEHAKLINELNANAVRQGQLRTQDSDSERYLWQQMQLLEPATWLYVGAERNGAFLGVTRTAEDESLAVLNDPSTYFQGYYYRLDRQGERVELVRVDEIDYDARSRPWYEAAVAARKGIWSNLYPVAGRSQLVLSAVQPVYGDAGSLIGVTGVDLSLEPLGRFLQRLKLGESGQAFVIDPAGLLVASSTGEKPFQPASEDRALARIAATESEDALTQAAAATLAEQIEIADFKGRTQFNFEFEQRPYAMQVSSYEDSYGFRWLTMVVMPERVRFRQ
ncbi:MAG: hypothetical protein F6J97_15775 [Leptolyngbya sp. SIO4C1]|nr:hypothetical protein [Leptolyngbya sp. SIO4C1]